MTSNVPSSSTASTAHGLTEAQLKDLQSAVIALDAHLMRSVYGLRNNLWQREATKQFADCRVQEYVVSFHNFYFIL